MWFKRGDVDKKVMCGERIVRLIARTDVEECVVDPFGKSYCRIVV